MVTIHIHQTTTATPGQFLAGLTDFGPGRSKLFGNSTDGYLKVHDQGPSQADVTEGSTSGSWPTSTASSPRPSRPAPACAGGPWVIARPQAHGFPFGPAVSRFG
jgi:hypothetical protein